MIIPAAAGKCNADRFCQKIDKIKPKQLKDTVLFCIISVVEVWKRAFCPLNEEDICMRGVHSAVDDIRVGVCGRFKQSGVSTLHLDVGIAEADGELASRALILHYALARL